MVVPNKQPTTAIMVFCIDARFSDESKQIEILDRSNAQVTLIECEGTLYVYNDVHPSPENPWKPLPTFNIDNIHSVHLNNARLHSTTMGKQMVIMLKDEEVYGEDGAGEFTCKEYRGTVY